jgi:hypothetical protein
VQRSLEESAQGLVDVDHTLAVARHWGRLPAETTIVEVEPADCSFGPGFSEVLAQAIDPLLAAIREELGCSDERPGNDELERELAAGGPSPDDAGVPDPTDDQEPSEALAKLVSYADRHKESRLLQPHRGATLFATPTPCGEHLTLLGKRRPWSVGAVSGGDWWDVVPGEDGWFSIVVGDVGARGVEAAATMEELRAATRAYVISTGGRPACVLELLDRLARATGAGAGATLVCLAQRPATGDLRLANAAHCPPLLLNGDGGARFLDAAGGAPVGQKPPRAPEARVFLPPGSTLLLYTDGLVSSASLSVAEGLAKLQRAGASAPAALEDLCEHVLSYGIAGPRRDDDISLLAARLGRTSNEERATTGLGGGSP